MEGLVEGLIEDAAEQVDVVGAFVRFLRLAGDLSLSDHHRVQRRGHPEEVADRRTAEVDIEAVVVGELGRAVGEVGEGTAEVEEQRVGVDPGFAAEVELDAVAGAEIDQLREPRQTGEIDELLVLEISGQRRGGELVDVGGAVAGTDDSDTIQTRRSSGA